MKVDYEIVTIRESTSASAPAQIPADRDADTALGRAGVRGSAPNYFQM